MPGFFTASTFLFWLPLTLLLAASTLNTKAPSFAWLLFMLAGLWAWWQYRRAPDAPETALDAANLPKTLYFSLVWLSPVCWLCGWCLQKALTPHRPIAYPGLLR